MPQLQRATLKAANFDLGLSYRLDEKALSYREVKNAMVNNRRLEKRYGIDFLIKDSGGDSPNFGAINSISYFKNTNGADFYLFKAGATLYRVDNDSTSFVSLKSGLVVDSKHRGITLNNRHFIAIGNDGLFFYDGNNFSKAGQQQPSGVTTVASGSGFSLAAGDYQVQITFYSTITGYESMPSSASTLLAVSGGQKITVSGIPATAENTFIDKVRVYLKKSTQVNYLFYSEIPLGTTSTEITSDANSSQNPPEDTQQLPIGGAKYLTEFNGRLMIAGNTQFPNEVIASNEDDPESFPDGATALRIAVSGDGPITGIATGLFSDTVLDPYLVIFKENSTWVYSEIGGASKLVQLNANIGCVSHDTIVVRNGDVYFLSRYGWYAIKNGRIVTKDSKPYSLGDDAIGDIFEDSGLDQYINRSKLSESFSVYFQNQDVYVTFLAANGSNEFYDAYVYNFGLDKFLKWKLPVNVVSAVTAEDSLGQEIILLGQKNPTWSIIRPSVLFKMSKNNPYADTYYPENEDSPVKVTAAIDWFAIINWIDGGDYDSTFNFREFLLRLRRYQPNITVKVWVNYTHSYSEEQEMELPEPDATFILDESYLDIDALGEGFDAVTARVDLNVTGENVLIGLFQNETNENIIITSGQLNFSKNGNRNK